MLHVHGRGRLSFPLSVGHDGQRATLRFNFFNVVPWRILIMTRSMSALILSCVLGSVMAWGTFPAMAAEPAPVEPAKSEPAKDPAPADSKGESGAKSTTDSKNTEPKKEDAVSAEPKKYYVKVATTKGDIVIELDNERAPISTKNFLAYTDKKQYDGTIFHRAIPGFMIQGGGMTADMKERPTDKSIKNESGNGLYNKRGMVAMARTQDLNSATCQFYINVVDNDFLDTNKYAVFGKVVSGMDVADKIVASPTGNKGMHQNVPKDPITINAVTRLTEAEAAPFVKQAAEPAKK